MKRIGAKVERSSPGAKASRRRRSAPGDARLIATSDRSDNHMPYPACRSHFAVHAARWKASLLYHTATDVLAATHFAGVDQRVFGVLAHAAGRYLRVATRTEVSRHGFQL